MAPRGARTSDQRELLIGNQVELFTFVCERGLSRIGNANSEYPVSRTFASASPRPWQYIHVLQPAHTSCLSHLGGGSRFPSRRRSNLDRCGSIVAMERRPNARCHGCCLFNASDVVHAIGSAVSMRGSFTSRHVGLFRRSGFTPCVPIFYHIHVRIVM